MAIAYGSYLKHAIELENVPGTRFTAYPYHSYVCATVDTKQSRVSCLEMYPGSGKTSLIGIKAKEFISKDKKNQVVIIVHSGFVF